MRSVKTNSHYVFLHLYIRLSTPQTVNQLDENFRIFLNVFRVGCASAGSATVPMLCFSPHNNIYKTLFHADSNIIVFNWRSNNNYCVE